VRGLLVVAADSGEQSRSTLLIKSSQMALRAVRLGVAASSRASF